MKKSNGGRNFRKRHNIKESCLPKDTAGYVKKTEPTNFALYLNKFALYRYNKEKLSKLPEPKISHVDIITQYYQVLSELNLKTRELRLDVADKLIIGLGAASVYEISLTLHHIYGIPYIPASAIKGSLRSYLIEKYFSNSEEKALQSEWFQKIFGTHTKQGSVYFFDAFASKGSLKIEKDIMNSHYPKYYSGEKPPTDDQDPNPINFYAIRGTFSFRFGVKKEVKLTIEAREVDILDFVESELRNSLKEFGIGAKTSVGYGYFKG